MMDEKQIKRKRSHDDKTSYSVLALSSQLNWQYHDIFEVKCCPIIAFFSMIQTHMDLTYQISQPEKIQVHARGSSGGNGTGCIIK